MSVVHVVIRRCPGGSGGRRQWHGRHSLRSARQRFPSRVLEIGREAVWLGDSEGGRLSKNGLVVLREALGQAPRTEPSHGDYLQRMVQRGDPMMDPFAESGVGVARSIQCRQFGRVIAPTDRPAPLGRSGRLRSAPTVALRY